MDPLVRLDAGHLRRGMAVFRDTLRAHQESINRLNVYPVPDGDTGTNMALTLESVVSELDSLGEGAASMAAVCDAIAHGSLMGARGNSGVILSQILRGVADRLRQPAGVGPSEMASALVTAADAAVGAVMRPVEGTILTVARSAGEAAQRVAEGDGSDDGALVDVLEGARQAAGATLAQTPELLSVLKEAGVVDAGGAGYVLMLDAFLSVVDGRPLPEPEHGDEAARLLVGTPSAFDPGAEAMGDLRYEVMYILEAPDESIPAFKDVWAGVGDSIVVVGGEGLWNCHIHTGDVGAAIEAALDAGRPRNISVTDLAEAIEEERWVREASAAPGPGLEGSGPPPATAVVAVATGEGVRRIFHSLGVHQIVAGGQSMNPSTAQILDAVRAAPAEQVVVLPNNDNIFPVADQVGGLTDKQVRVVRTRGIAEGFAALLEYDPQARLDDNAASMRLAAGRVIAGEVTRAVRDSRSPQGPIAAKDWLGMSATGLEVVGADLADAACALLDRLVSQGHEIVTIIEGDGATAGDTRRVTQWLAEHRPAVTAEVHHGGQPLYPYLFSIE